MRSIYFIGFLIFFAACSEEKRDKSSVESFHVQYLSGNSIANNSCGAFQIQITNDKSEESCIDPVSFLWIDKNDTLHATVEANASFVVRENETVVKDYIIYAPNKMYSKTNIDSITLVSSFLSSKDTVKVSRKVALNFLQDKTKRFKYSRFTCEFRESLLLDEKRNIKVLKAYEMFYEEAQYFLTQDYSLNSNYILKEVPPIPYFGYCQGKAILLNTDFVESSMNRMNLNILDFGWLYFLGTDLTSPFLQKVASEQFKSIFSNLLVAGTLERIQSKRQDYYIELAGKKQDLASFNKNLFVKKANDYLLDKNRAWSTVESDELQGLLMNVIYKEGWHVLSLFYKNVSEINLPVTEYARESDRLLLLLASFDLSTETKMEDLYTNWRIPFSKVRYHYFLNKLSTVDS